MPQLPNDLVSVAAVARDLSVSPSAVYRWIAAERITAYRVGGRLRVSLADASAFVQRTGPGENRSSPAKKKSVPSRAEAEELLRRTGAL